MKQKLKLLGFLLVSLMVGVFLFFGKNNSFSDISKGNSFVESISSEVYAETGTEEETSSEDSDSGGLMQMLENILQVLYILLWPLLSVAGVSLDNSLVYGEFFNLDVSLWHFWNIMKNFANYALGFIFIFSVLIYIFNSKFSDKFSPKKILPKLLIAGILVQASWFVVAALIDLSTVATYGLGTLPMSVMEEDIGGKKGRAMAVPHAGVNLGTGSIAEPDTFMNIYYTSPSKEGKFIQCVFSGGKIQEITEDKRESVAKKIDKIESAGDINSNICVYQNALVKAGDSGNSQDSEEGYLNYVTANKDKSLEDFIDRSSGFTGPLFTLYQSILQLGSMPLEGANKTDGSLSMIFMIKVLVGAALIIPLLTLAVILVVRVVVLWLIIGFSPIIVLSETFGFKLGGDKASLSSILGLIFLPVTAVFAISISIIFLSLLNNFNYGSGGGNDDENGKSAVKEALSLGDADCGGEKEAGTANESKIYDGFSIKNPEMDICFALPNKESGISPILNIFSWLIINIFGIGLMWAVVFASMKTSKFTNNIVEGVDKFAQQTAKAAPVVPTPMGQMSVGSVEKAWDRLPQVPDVKIQDQYDRGPGKLIERMKDGMDGRGTSYEEVKNNDKSNLVNTLQTAAAKSSENVTKAMGRGLAGNESKYNNINEALKSQEFGDVLKNNPVDVNKVAENLSGAEGVEKENIQKILAQNTAEYNEGEINVGDKKFRKMGDYIYELDGNGDQTEGGAYIIKTPDEVENKEELKNVIEELNNMGLDRNEVENLLKGLGVINNSLDDYKTQKGEGIKWNGSKFVPWSKSN